MCTEAREIGTVRGARPSASISRWRGRDIAEGTGTFTLRFTEASLNPPEDAMLEVPTHKIRPPVFKVARLVIDDSK